VVLIRNVQNPFCDIGVEREVHHQSLQPSQCPSALKDRSYRHTHDPVFVLERPEGPRGVLVKLRAVGVRGPERCRVAIRPYGYTLFQDRVAKISKVPPIAIQYP
jgi:hypothetical protein